MRDLDQGRVSPPARRAPGKVGAFALWAVEAVFVAVLWLFIAGIVAAPFVAGWLVGRDQHDNEAGPAVEPRSAAGWASASADGPMLLFPFAEEAALIGPGGPVGSGCRVTSPVPVTRLALPTRTAYRIGGHPGAVTCRVGVAEVGLLLEFAGTPATGPAPPPSAGPAAGG